MKVNGFRMLLAMVATTVVFWGSNASAQSSKYQYLIGDTQAQDGADGTVAQDTAVVPQADATVDAADIEGNTIEFHGWLQSGYHTYNTGMFNNQDSRFQLNQAYFYAEKAANSDLGLGLGFRIDYVYGTDGQDTQAFFGPANSWDNSWDNGGFYGQAIPQLYGEVALGDVSVKVGHFYTIMGYEVVTAPDNFFYSHAFTMFNSEPFTHTGILAEMDMGDVTLWGGWTLGWDSGFDASISDGNNFLGGISYSFGDFGSFTQTMTAGRLGAGSTTGTGWSTSSVMDINLTDNFEVILQSDMVDNPGVNESYGFNSYWLLSLTENVRFGTRMEWWKNSTFGAALGDSDLYAITSGLNINLGNVIIRPEVRWDKDNDGFLIPVNHNQRLGFGMDAIITY